MVGPNIVPPEDNSATALTEALLVVGAAGYRDGTHADVLYT